MRKAPATALAGTVVAAAAAAGARFGPTPGHPRTAAWYLRLHKPAFTPPGPVFGAAWTVLDGLLWYCGARLLTCPARPARTLALGSWGLTMLGVGGFQFVLFGRRRLGAATGVTAAMVATSAALVGSAAAVDRKASLAAMPLAAWVMFAFVLQEEVWRRNRS
jgi:tryptophan-rich sensory protein